MAPAQMCFDSCVKIPLAHPEGKGGICGDELRRLAEGRMHVESIAVVGILPFVDDRLIKVW